MQDIDFDEIDRAVSSVAKPNARPSTPPYVAEPVAVTVAPISAPVVTETPTEASSPAVRRSSGRFMDVVHSSSDMRPESRPVVLPHASAEQPQDVVREPLPEALVEPKEHETLADAAFHWPDPIETPETEELEEPVVETKSEPTPIIPVQEITGPLESPFIVDAKVEKRPLGAFSDTDLPLLEDFPAPKMSEKLAAAIETGDESPRELHDDMLLLDAHNDDEEPKAIEPTPVDIPTGPTSITQQYVEQPSTTSQSSGSIFDTEAYNVALSHAPKTRSKTIIIVWIVALVLVGGGIGAGIYFIVLPMLG